MQHPLLPEGYTLADCVYDVSDDEEKEKVVDKVSRNGLLVYQLINEINRLVWKLQENFVMNKISSFWSVWK